MKYNATVAISALIEVEVEANNMEEAEDKALLAAEFSSEELAKIPQLTAEIESIEEA